MTDSRPAASAEADAALLVQMGARLHEETWHIQDEDMPALLAAIRSTPTPDATDALRRPNQRMEELRRYFWRCLDDPDAVPMDTELDRLMLAIRAEPDATDADPLFDPFVAAAAVEMRARLDHGATKFGRSWRNHYSDRANLDRLRRAVDHLEVAHRNSGPHEWAKRAADVANQAFMFADPRRRP